MTNRRVAKNASRTNQIGSIGRCHNNNAAQLAHAVHFDQHLAHNAIGSTAAVAATCARQRVQFVEKHNLHYALSDVTTDASRVPTALLRVRDETLVARRARFHRPIY